MTRLYRVALAGLALIAGIGVMIVAWPVHLPRVTAPMIMAQEGLGDGPHPVFGYATLTHPLVRLVVVGRHAPTRAAALPDMRREGRDLRPEPGAALPGKVFDVSADGLLRLDRYERLGARYRRDLMPLDDGNMAWVYRRLP
ncbi:MAG: gamma-glutamylcyclotransferase family protein [Rhodobacterales bacterium]